MLCVYLRIAKDWHISIYPLSIYLSTYLPIYLSIYQSIHPSIYLSIYLHCLRESSANLAPLFLCFNFSSTCLQNCAICAVSSLWFSYFWMDWTRWIDLRYPTFLFLQKQEPILTNFIKTWSCHSFSLILPCPSVFPPWFKFLSDVYLVQAKNGLPIFLETGHRSITTHWYWRSGSRCIYVCTYAHRY